MKITNLTLWQGATLATKKTAGSLMINTSVAWWLLWRPTGYLFTQLGPLPDSDCKIVATNI